MASADLAVQHGEPTVSFGKTSACNVHDPLLAAFAMADENGYIFMARSHPWRADVTHERLTRGMSHAGATSLERNTPVDPVTGARAFSARCLIGNRIPLS